MAHHAVSGQHACRVETGDDAYASAETVVRICVHGITDLLSVLRGCVKRKFLAVSLAGCIAVERWQNLAHGGVFRLCDGLLDRLFRRIMDNAEYRAHGKSYTRERQSHRSQSRFHAVSSFLRGAKRLGRTYLFISGVNPFIISMENDMPSGYAPQRRMTAVSMPMSTP